MSFARVRGPGHPDQVCDLVAAGIVEEYLRRDAQSRLNIRVAGGRGVLFLAGDLLSSADFDVSSVAKRIVASCGVSIAMEPFIAFEPMLPAWGPAVGAREPITTMGYATSETEDRFPKSISIARDVARELERRRTMDEPWYWLGSDYEVAVDFPQAGQPPLLIVRAEHLETQSLLHVRTALTHLVKTRQPTADVRVNLAGEEVQAGLRSRMGACGRRYAPEQYGSTLPGMMCGVGRQLTHPLNAGSYACRALARRLVDQGRGKAILIQATWLPFEARPAFIRVRNERGQDLSSEIEVAQLDLSTVSSTYLLPSLASAVLQAPYDASVALPWEQKM